MEISTEHFFQHRSGGVVYQYRVYESAQSSRCAHQLGWPRTGLRQHFRGTRAPMRTLFPRWSSPTRLRGSIEAAMQYVRFKSVELDLSQDWYENLDVAVLATYMGVPKEGSSAGITIATGIVSALKKQPVRNDIAMTGEITIMGKVLAVGGIQQKIRAADDAGVKEILLPADNLKEAGELPSYILEAVKLIPIHSVDEVLRYALIEVATK